MTNHSTSDIPEPELFDKIEALISGFKIEEYMNLSSEHKKNLRSNYKVIKWYEPQHLPKEAIVLREDTKNFYRISIDIETDDTDGMLRHIPLCDFIVGSKVLLVFNREIHVFFNGEPRDQSLDFIENFRF